MIPQHRPRADRQKRRTRNAGNHWVVRLVRGRRLDRNPLRRKTDRIETVVLGVLLAGFLAGAPFAASAAGTWAYASSAREAQAQRAVIYPVQATLLQAASSWNEYPEGGTMPDAAARWRAPDGQLRTGTVYVPGGGAAGSTKLIWVSLSGQQSDPPLQASQIAGRVELARAIAVVALAVALAVPAGLTWRTLNGRRLAGWDADWLTTGPRWSPRR
jgi:hypothetical protein